MEINSLKVSSAEIEVTGSIKATETAQIDKGIITPSLTIGSAGTFTESDFAKLREILI